MKIGMVLFIGVVIGFIFGALLSIGLALKSFDNSGILNECQKHLPRSQICVLKAVPQLTTKGIDK